MARPASVGVLPAVGRCALLAGAFVLLFACSVAPRATEMGSIDASGLSKSTRSLGLEVSSKRTAEEVEGGMGWIEAPDLGPKELESAIRAAVEQSGFLGAFRLDAKPVLRAELRRARFAGGLSYTRDAEVIVDWSLIDGVSDQPLWKERVSSSFRRTFGDDFSGYARTRNALEGAVKANIQEAFLKLDASQAIQRAFSGARP